MISTEFHTPRKYTKIVKQIVYQKNNKKYIGKEKLCMRYHEKYLKYKTSNIFFFTKQKYKKEIVFLEDIEKNVFKIDLLKYFNFTYVSTYKHAYDT